MNFERDATARILELERQIDRLKTASRQVRTPGQLAAIHLGLDGLTGLWAAGSRYRSTGNLADLSGQGRALTYNGNPTYNRYNSLIAYADLDGAGDYFSRTHETDLGIIGTESINASAIRGLTYGGWFWFDALAANATFLGKRGASYAWFLQWELAATRIISYLSSNGTSLHSTSYTYTTTGTWVNIVARFTPGTENALFIDGELVAANTTSVPSSLYNSADPFGIGAIPSSGAEALNGRVALAFVCAAALSDDQIGLAAAQGRELMEG